MIAEPIIFFSSKFLVSSMDRQECPVVHKLAGRGVGSIGRTLVLENVVMAKDFDCVMMTVILVIH